MQLHQVSAHCFAGVNEKNRVSDAYSGLINCGGGVILEIILQMAVYAGFPAAPEAVKTAASVFAE